MLPTLVTPKKRVIEAYQWLGVDAATGEFNGVSPDELRAWGCPSRETLSMRAHIGTTFASYSCKLDVKLWIDGETKIINVRHREWIVKIGPRKFVVMNDADFSEAYERYIPLALPPRSPRVVCVEATQDIA